MRTLDLLPPAEKETYDLVENDYFCQSLGRTCFLVPSYPVHYRMELLPNA